MLNKTLRELRMICNYIMQDPDPVFSRVGSRSFSNENRNQIPVAAANEDNLQLRQLFKVWVSQLVRSVLQPGSWCSPCPSPSSLETSRSSTKIRVSGILLCILEEYAGYPTCLTFGGINIRFSICTDIRLQNIWPTGYRGPDIPSDTWSDIQYTARSQIQYLDLMDIMYPAQ